MLAIVQLDPEKYQEIFEVYQYLGLLLNDQMIKHVFCRSVNGRKVRAKQVIEVLIVLDNSNSIYIIQKVAQLGNLL